jgi:hypothetical protein
MQLGRLDRGRFNLGRVIIVGLVMAALAVLLPATEAQAANGRWLHEDHEIVLGYGCTPFELEPFDARFNCPQGWRVHEAIDFDTPEGTPVYAGIAGTVLDVGGKETKDYGPNYVRMLLPDGHDLILGHLRSASVRAGDRLRTGQLIGYTGILGVTNWPNLHFEVRVHDGTTHTSINPGPYLTLSSGSVNANLTNPARADDDSPAPAPANPTAAVVTESGADPLTLLAQLAPFAPVGGAPMLLIAILRWRRHRHQYSLAGY